MIDDNYRYGYSAFCMVCNKQVGDFDYYHECEEWMKAHGWKWQKLDGKWGDVCPECLNLVEQVKYLID